MGHYIEDPDTLFSSVRYRTKTSPELREAMQKKVNELRGYISDRDQRIRKIREEFQIDAERLAQLLLQFQKNNTGFVSYNAQGSDGRSVVVPAGVIANLIQEQQMIDSEREQIRKLELILRNLRDTEPYAEPRTGEVRTRPCLHQLTDNELEFLGF